MFDAENDRKTQYKWTKQKKLQICKQIIETEKWQ